MNESTAYNQKGVSLIESLMVVVALGFIVFLLSSLPGSMGLINKSNHLSLAREIASKQLEDKRATNYANLVNDTTVISDSRISLLPNGSATVAVEDCDALICTNGEHIKQITVTVNWKDNNKTQSITVKTFIAEGGLNQ